MLPGEQPAGTGFGAFFVATAVVRVATASSPRAPRTCVLSDISGNLDPLIRPTQYDELENLVLSRIYTRPDRVAGTNLREVDAGIDAGIIMFCAIVRRLPVPRRITDDDYTFLTVSEPA